MQNKEVIELWKLALSLIVLMGALAIYISIQGFATESSAEFVENVSTSTDMAVAEKINTIDEQHKLGNTVSASLISGALYEAYDLEFLSISVQEPGVLTVFHVDNVTPATTGTASYIVSEIPCAEAAQLISKYSIHEAELCIVTDEITGLPSLEIRIFNSRR